ncbi:DUF742 domain-containing protein [Streptomyces sodiiphilus]
MQEPEAAALVRPYVITNGRNVPEGDELSLITLVTAVDSRQQWPALLSPEEQSVLRMCSGGYLAVAEIVGHMGLPMGVVKVLLSSLAERGYLTTRAPVERAQQVDEQILQEVLDGLRARFG